MDFDKFYICLWYTLYLLSELLENLKAMFPRYYMRSDMFSMHTYSTTQQCVIRSGMINSIHVSNTQDASLN